LCILLKDRHPDCFSALKYRKELNLALENRRNDYELIIEPRRDRGKVFGWLALTAERIR